MKSANTCVAISSEISNCAKYWDDYDIIHSSQPKLKCKMCKPGYYALTDEKSSIYRCKTGDDGISDCAYPGKYVFADGKVIRYCMGCNEDFIGVNYDAFVGAATGCNQNDTDKCSITNCLYCGKKDAKTDCCFGCKDKFAASQDMTKCVAYTDSNCQTLDSTNTKCETCWWPYRFDGSACSRSTLMYLTSVVLLSALFS